MNWRAVGGVMLRNTIAGFLILASSSFAHAQSLDARSVLANVEGVWGWAGDTPTGDDLSCSGDPSRIWLEENGTVYKSQRRSGGKIYVSKVVLPQAGAANPNYILISYLNHPQPAVFGLQAVWALRMPDKDHFTWQEFPYGTIMAPHERCGETPVG
jgi:hypothetical protein